MHPPDAGRGQAPVRRIIATVTVAVLAGLAFWLWRSIEWKEEEVDRGLSEAARQNPMLAAERFLRSLGLAAESRRGFALLDQIHTDTSPIAATDNLILINAHRTLGEERLETLWQWVQNGGHLIVSTRNQFLGNSNPEQDLLLARLGITLVDEAAMREALADEPQEQRPNDPGRARGRSAAETDLPAPAATPDAEPGCFPQTVEVIFDGEQQPLQADWYGGHSFVDGGDRATGWINSQFGVKLLQFELEQGMITVTTDNGIWTNTDIDCHDHAYMLWLFAGDTSKTWFIINQDAPSLWSTLWRAAPYGMLFATLALLLWLWKQPVRFGPIRVQTQLDRRRFIEHSQANAAFLWRHRQQHTLIENLRNTINQQLRRRHRGYAQLSAGAQLETLQRVTSLPLPLLERAMLGAVGTGEQEFQQLVAQLQKIRNCL
ncbi:DUF4350 domain-containing protein [Exilibacterium tricleocarpae]|uniref:DUF4350 domain-containing protein n=1 Tax=Exilibacterium tricleocarpae TaxID=2591008 RepID=A0A545T2A4_9GAMM|nr:DUF4350 domain-containing protein [Exilibacterium tricleocarpae]TQV71357.1 DUF4350 domain-containing protein [Exilibacterium tricleocarpae]